ncbi:unnamed protein product [Acanthoscelides obtectus]|uniref:Uncharacterized protein n=1 Tax=Acanthoscelides obtectus TaxID=200917 RepID=A0A9P0M9V9_ACAOB|nr:unnamed protein product [Acanthoscelides obtectus]CAK1655773.1 hypothetical protein AOBTE_LOCUS19323 [Acanthoscelides obtectus]
MQNLNILWVLCITIASQHSFVDTAPVLQEIRAYFTKMLKF